MKQGKREGWKGPKQNNRKTPDSRVQREGPQQSWIDPKTGRLAGKGHIKGAIPRH